MEGAAGSFSLNGAPRSCTECAAVSGRTIRAVGTWFRHGNKGSHSSKVQMLRELSSPRTRCDYYKCYYLGMYNLVTTSRNHNTEESIKHSFREKRKVWLIFSSVETQQNLPMQRYGCDLGF